MPPLKKRKRGLTKPIDGRTKATTEEPAAKPINAVTKATTNTTRKLGFGDYVKNRYIVAKW